MAPDTVGFFAATLWAVGAAIVCLSVVVAAGYFRDEVRMALLGVALGIGVGVLTVPWVLLP